MAGTDQGSPNPPLPAEAYSKSLGCWEPGRFFAKGSLPVWLVLCSP